MVIEAGQVAQRVVARLLEAVDVLRGFGGPLGGVGDEVLDDQRIGELLGQDRRDADGQPERHALFAQVVERVQQRDIGLGDRLVHPLLAVRPHPRLPGVREMAVQHEREGPDWRCHVIPPLRRIPISGSTRLGTLSATVSRTRVHLQRVGRVRHRVVVRIVTPWQLDRARSTVGLGQLAQPVRQPFVQLVRRVAPGPVARRDCPGCSCARHRRDASHPARERWRDRQPMPARSG